MIVRRGAVIGVPNGSPVESLKKKTTTNPKPTDDQIACHDVGSIYSPMLSVLKLHPE
jgi:hypothetical protein